jgi:hypothetical protein
MSKSRLINTSIWDDDYFADLNPEEKLCWFYILTNPSTELKPFFQLPSKKISSFRLGFSIEPHLKKFEQDGKIKICKNYILIINWLKHQTLNDNQKKGIENAFSELDQEIKDCFTNLTLPNPSEPFESVSNDTEPLPNPSDNLTKLNLTKLNLTEENLTKQKSTPPQHTPNSVATLPQQISTGVQQLNKEINKESKEVNIEDSNKIIEFLNQKIQNQETLDAVVEILVKEFDVDIDTTLEFLNWYDSQWNAWKTDNLMKIKFKVKDWIKFGKPKPDTKDLDKEEGYQTPPPKSVLPDDPEERQAYLLELAELSSKQTQEFHLKSTPPVPAEGKKAISFANFFDSNLSL